jgi:hypothetical protein
VKISETKDKTDFFMVLDGQCYLSYDVKITYDQSDALKMIQNRMNSFVEDFEITEDELLQDTFKIRFKIP